MTNSPDRLVNLCAQVCVSHPEQTFLIRCNGKEMHGDEDFELDFDSEDGPGYIVLYDEINTYDDSLLDPPYKWPARYKLKDNIYLPDDITELLLENILKDHPDDYIGLFHDRRKCRLTKVDFSDAQVTDQVLIAGLFCHPLREANFSGCVLYAETFAKLNECSETLKILKLTGTKGDWYVNFTPVRNLKNLIHLDLSDSKFGKLGSADLEAVASLSQLTSLDLSWCEMKDILSLAPLGRYDLICILKLDLFLFIRWLFIVKST